VAEHAVVHIGYTLITYELVHTGIADASEQTAATLFVCMLLCHCSNVEAAELASGDVICLQIVEPQPAATAHAATAECAAAAATSDGDSTDTAAEAAAAVDASPPRQKPITAMSDTGASGESTDDDERAVRGASVQQPSNK
jgi:hypothetical protein